MPNSATALPSRTSVNASRTTSPFSLSFFVIDINALTASSSFLSLCAAITILLPTRLIRYPSGGVSSYTSRHSSRSALPISISFSDAASVPGMSQSSATAIPEPSSVLR